MKQSTEQCGDCCSTICASEWLRFGPKFRGMSNFEDDADVLDILRTTGSTLADAASHIEQSRLGISVPRFDGRSPGIRHFFRLRLLKMLPHTFLWREVLGNFCSLVSAVWDCQRTDLCCARVRLPSRMTASSRHDGAIAPVRLHLCLRSCVVRAAPAVRRVATFSTRSYEHRTRKHICKPCRRASAAGHQTCISIPFQLSRPDVMCEREKKYVSEPGHHQSLPKQIQCWSSKSRLEVSRIN
jgi:hypothetical protein